ncbi:uncharacterized protein LOC130047053 [Ostrea edulis]|uniref:uncharacterized protein LOC130047053 n=1 Tax=Ostrea edulis TaxID=37623 RepID=UPI0024AEE885|nr:uncharacterized protein LOC130047053 [Ostrea edulis]
MVKVVDKHIPLKERRINSRSEEWINDDILTEMHCREHLFKKATQSNDGHAWNLYRASRNRVTKKIREEKHAFVEEAISQAENKDMWDKLRQFLPSKKTNTNCTFLKDNNVIFKDTKDIAECFNNYFCNIGHELGKHFDDTLPTVEE